MMAEKVVRVQMVKRVIDNQHFKTWVVVSAYVFLYFMYADSSEPEKAREFGFFIHMNHSFFTFMQGLLSLTWYFKAPNKPQKALFLSFSIFCLLRLLYRLYAIVFDDYLVTSSPMYFMMLFIVLVLLFLERKYGRD